MGRGSNPIFAHGKMCVFPFFPWGKMGKKVYGKKGKSIHFSLFPYTFFPIFPPWEKMGKHTFSHGQKWGWTPYQAMYTVILLSPDSYTLMIGQA